MFYIISAIFGVSGVIVLCLLKALTVCFDFFKRNQSVFTVLFSAAFVFLYNYCIYDYKPKSKIIYIIANLLFIVVLGFADYILYKERN